MTPQTDTLCSWFLFFCCAVLSELTEDKAVREFWVTSVDHNLLSIHPERLLTTMEQKFALRIADRFQVSPSRGKSRGSRVWEQLVWALDPGGWGLVPYLCQETATSLITMLTVWLVDEVLIVGSFPLLVLHFYLLLLLSSSLSSSCSCLFVPQQVPDLKKKKKK